MNIAKIIDYWVESSKLDFQVAKDLFEKKRYSYCLFFCHLAIEKMLKAIIAKRTNQHAPYIHHLVRLADLSGITLSQEHKELLAEMLEFNLRARYNDFKLRFYRKCTRLFAKKYLKLSKNLYQWLENQLHLKK